MTDPRLPEAQSPLAPFPGWCCSYCAEPLEARPYGLYCAAEERFFATDRGIHRLLPEDRLRETRAFLELYRRERRDEGCCAAKGLPDVAPDHPQAEVWRDRAARFWQALELAEAILGQAPWRALDLGAGCCWIGARLAERGHRVAAVDINLDPEEGLAAAARLLPRGLALERAEAEMGALPIEPQSFELVIAGAALHYASSLARTLVELRRVTRRGGVLLVLDSPVYRSRPDGEAMVADRMRRQAERYGVPAARENQPGYLVLGELRGLFASAGWRLEVHGWPSRLREWMRDALAVARHRRRPPRYPILLARRDG